MMTRQNNDKHFLEIMNFYKKYASEKTKQYPAMLSMADRAVYFYYACH